MILYSLPFAGGSAYSFMGFKDVFYPAIELRSLESPGHGARMEEPLLYSMQAVAGDYFNQIDSTMGPFVIWGHSMGAIAAYLVTLRLVQENCNIPEALFVSGCSGIPLELKQVTLHKMPSEQFWRELISFGGIPDELTNEVELLKLFEPVLRADICAVENFYLDKYERINIPIINLLSDKDNIIHEGIMHREVVPWDVLSTASYTTKPLAGDHFFIYKNVKSIKGIIEQFLFKQ